MEVYYSWPTCRAVLQLAELYWVSEVYGHRYGRYVMYQLKCGIWKKYKNLKNATAVVHSWSANSWKK